MEECSDTEPETDSDCEWEPIDEERYLEGASVNEIVLEEEEGSVFGAIMSQLSLKKGLKAWGKRAEKSAVKEMTQLHDMSSFIPRTAKSLTR